MPARSLPGSHALVQAARSAVRDMPDVRAHLLPIATGDVVLADAESEITRFVRGNHNDAGAIEMEGFGALQAAHLNGRLNALVIRGISDRADAQKHKADAAGSQKRAAGQAAAVTVAVLHKHRPHEGSSVSPDSEEGPRPRGDDGTAYGGDRIDFRNSTFHGPVTGKQSGGQRRGNRPRPCLTSGRRAHALSSLPRAQPGPGSGVARRAGGGRGVLWGPWLRAWTM